MINTYQTSLAPPPVPPRLNRSHPVLIPTPLPAQSNNKPLIRFLVAVAMLNLVLCVGGFIYLYHNFKTERYTAEGKVASYTSEKEKARSKILAHMVPEPPTEPKSNYLSWNINQSVRKNINYYEKRWLTILESGEYYVYSRVTFSKGHATNPLSSQIRLRKSKAEKADKPVTKAYCYLNSSLPNMCTATQGEVITLEKGNQLSVWVDDPLLVDYEEGATTFGLYKL